MLMKISPPTMRGSLVVSMATISPSRREVSPAESLRRRAKVLLPKFRLETAALCPESLLLISSRANGLIYQKMGTEGWPMAPQATRARLGGWLALVPRGNLGGPLWYFFLPVFFIYFKINLHKISAHLEMCRIGISDIAFSGPEFQLPAISLLV